MKKITSILSLAFLLICAHSIGQKLHTPAEILEVLEKSKLSYEFGELKEEIPPKDNSLNLNSAEFYRKAEGESLITMKVELTEEAFKIKEQAEVYFRDRDYSKAREAYQQVLDIHPEYSKLITYIGQTYYSQGEKAKAMEHFKKAIENNYIDYMAHWFLARLYLENNDLEKAVDEALVAHILNRNHKLVTNELMIILDKAGYTFDNWTFTPQIKLSTQDSQKINIQFKSEWMGYALAKAVWAFEPNYRESMGVTNKEIVSVLEEKEALLAFYVGNSKNKSVTKTSLFNSLSKSIDNQQLDEFIFYEIFITSNPFIAYQFPEELISNIKKYILESKCKSSKKGNKKK